MSQFYISATGEIRFDCDCGRPLQPFVDDKTETVKCEECGKKITNPFHKSNPYNIDARFIHAPKIQGIRTYSPIKILIVIIILSVLSGLIVFMLESKNIFLMSFLSLDSLLPSLIIANITIVSLVSIFAVFGKNRVLEKKEDFAKPIREKLKRYSNKEVGLSGISHYKFDTDVLEGLKKAKINNNGWFFDFINIETYDELERSILEKKLKKTIVRPGLGIAVVSILLLPFSTLFNSIHFLEISVTIFLVLGFLYEVFSSFNYIYVVFEIFSIDLKLFYWRVEGEKHLRVSRIMDMFRVKI